MAQEKLGGVKQDLLQQKLEKDTANNKIVAEEKKQMKDKAKKKEQKSKEEMAELKKQFRDEQQYKREQLSKRNEKDGDKKPDPKAMTLQRQQRMKQLELDEQSLVQEDAFFQKWLKQRENLGSERENLNVTQSAIKSSSVTKLATAKKKDATQKELDELNKNLKKEAHFKNYSIDKRTVRKALNVNIITAATVEAFIKYLDITEDDTEYDTSKKLTQNLQRKSSARSDRKNEGADGFKSNLTGTTNPIKEVPEEQKE